MDRLGPAHDGCAVRGKPDSEPRPESRGSLVLPDSGDVGARTGGGPGQDAVNGVYSLDSCAADDRGSRPSVGPGGPPSGGPARRPTGVVAASLDLTHPGIGSIGCPGMQGFCRGVAVHGADSTIPLRCRPTSGSGPCPHPLRSCARKRRLPAVLRTRDGARADGRADGTARPPTCSTLSTGGTGGARTRGDPGSACAAPRGVWQRRLLQV